MADSTGAPNTLPVMINGVESELSNTQAATVFGAGNIKKPTKNFTINYKGLHIQGFKNIPIVCDSALLTALAACGAPVV